MLIENGSQHDSQIGLYLDKSSLEKYTLGTNCLPVASRTSFFMIFHDFWSLGALFFMIFGPFLV